MAFENSEWIWYTKNEIPDSYGDFKETFSYSVGNSVINLSVDGDYELYVNGEFVSSNQYADFEHYKIYDSIDITKYLNRGENELYILVWHFGIDSSRYKSAPAGLIYELLTDGKAVIGSGTHTLSRENPYYRSNYKKIISGQLGQSFLYDSTADTAPYAQSVLADKSCNMFKRPIKKLEFAKKIIPTLIKREQNTYLFDLGREAVGVPYFDISSDSKQLITLSWGEHIADGCVRRKIGTRDFSLEYIAKIGENRFVNRMLRLGCRYIELNSPEPIEINELYFIPQIYPVEEKVVKFDNPTDRRLYDISVNTLKLCMLEHYVDTPWREQSFYSFDSRNQMLCGYKAFVNGNREYARAALLLISKDVRCDGLLSITYPSGGELAIPSFSLHYFTAVREYTEFTGDTTLASEVFGKLSEIAEVFIKQINRDGLLESFVETDKWNFYDWSPNMVEDIGVEGSKPDLMINCLFITAMNSLEKICAYTGREFTCREITNRVKNAAKKAFYSENDGLFFMHEYGEEYTELANSMAIIAGLTDDGQSEFICKRLTSGELLECSLSNKCFKYDALLSVNNEYRKEIIEEIHENYKEMLDSGSSTVWEVSEGEAAFENAGSLCHGWSAVPILYLENS